MADGIRIVTYDSDLFSDGPDFISCYREASRIRREFPSSQATSDLHLIDATCEVLSEYDARLKLTYAHELSSLEKVRAPVGPETCASRISKIEAAFFRSGLLPFRIQCLSSEEVQVEFVKPHTVSLHAIPGRQYFSSRASCEDESRGLAEGLMGAGLTPLVKGGCKKVTSYGGQAFFNSSFLAAMPLGRWMFRKNLGQFIGLRACQREALSAERGFQMARLPVVQAYCTPPGLSGYRGLWTLDLVYVDEVSLHVHSTQGGPKDTLESCERIVQTTENLLRADGKAVVYSHCEPRVDRGFDYWIFFLRAPRTEEGESSLPSGN